jgi:hypothetical protein
MALVEHMAMSRSAMRADVRGGKRALSWTVEMPERGDVWATSDAPGATSMGGWDERVARSWARALGVVVEAVEVARLQLPQRGNVSSPVRMRAGRRRSGSGTVPKTSRTSRRGVSKERKASEIIVRTKRY